MSDGTPMISNPQLDRLAAVLRSKRSVVVAYSGGVDSAVVAAVAHRELGGEKVLACLGVSPSLARIERRDALRLAGLIGVAVRTVRTNELQNPGYIANAGDRCFHCKATLFAALAEVALQIGFAAVADGVHLDDLHNHTGGIAAARRFGVCSPLMEAGLVKADVRRLAHQLQLPVWDKPAMPCLASRLAIGTPVTSELLSTIERAEELLQRMGFDSIRVRHHDKLARIEVPVDQFPRLLQVREAVVGGLHGLGYQHVTLDLVERRTESLPVLPYLG
jgi:uncharacterized protein